MSDESQINNKTHKFCMKMCQIPEKVVEIRGSTEISARDLISMIYLMKSGSFTIETIRLEKSIITRQFNNIINRDLDFSQEGRLTSLSDIETYFKWQRKNMQIRKINLLNVSCITSAEILKNFLSRGENLVEINIQGIEFTNLVELALLLTPLMHLQRLSVDWPRTSVEDVGISRKILEGPFGRLKYLSVRFRWMNFSIVFIATLQICVNLEELRIAQLCSDQDNYTAIWNIVHRPLEHLKIVEYCGYGSKEVLDHIGVFFKDPNEWTEFRIAPNYPFHGFYMERNIEACKMLSDPKFFLEDCPLTDCLLTQIIARTCDNKRGDYCCLSAWDEHLPCLMKINEFKLLLKNFEYPITYLKISHSIESYCSAHLLASIFPSLTELVLTNLIKGKDWCKRSPHPKKRFRRIGTLNSIDMWNTNEDSCFKMLVDNTPKLRNFTINAKTILLTRGDKWDLEALRSISNWTELKSLILRFIPIRNGRFLIDIGKKCSYLGKLELQSLGPWDNCCFSNELAEMLSHCKNLKELTIKQNNLRKISNLLMLLVNNPELRKVSLRCRARDDAPKEIISSIEYLLEQCPRLNTLLCIVDGLPTEDSEELTLALRRLRIQLNRPTLQFQVRDDDGTEDLIVEDYTAPAFPWNLDRFNTT